jgi:hypothetical protein
VLKDGRVAEQGTHTELIDAGGVYGELWRGTNSSLHFLSRAAWTDQFLIAQETALSEDVDPEKDIGLDKDDSR